MTPSLSSPTAFLLGMALSLLPALGPFSAALLLVSRRWTLERRDLLWGAAAFTFGLAGVVSGGLMTGLTAFAAVVGPWIVFRTFVELKNLDLTHARRGSLAWGLLAGFGLVIAMGLLRSITTLDLLATRTVADAIVWSGSPALFGHSVLVLGGLIALLTQEHRRVAWSAMGLAAFGIVVSGSVEAAIAWVGLATALIALRPSGARRPRVYEIALVLLVIALAGGLAPLLGWGRIGFLLPAAEDGAAGRNLLSGTEVPIGDWWDDRWVEVRTSTAKLNGAELTSYDVTKLGEEGWLRLQQLVRLAPGTTYTLSGWIDPSGDAVPGFQGWGESEDGTGPLVLTATLRDGTWRAGMSGLGEIVEAREIARDGSWRRVAVTFAVHEGAEPLTWFVGFAPDARLVDGSSSRVAGLMLEASDQAGPYQPGLATSGLDFGYARAPLWRVAWDGIRERPLFGWGSGTFPDLYRQSLPGIERQEIVPAHPHNLALLVLLEKGVVGLIGLALLLVSLFGLAVRYRDLGLLAVVAAILFANIFDATLLSGAVLYPLAAGAGWRSAMRGARRTEGTEGVRQLVVRAGLAGADLLVAFVALLAAQAVAASLGAPFELSSPILYALLVWPALAWREGLYPGYGLTAAQELKKQMATWTYAAAIFVVGTRLFPATLDVSAPGLAVLLAGTVLGTPLARAGTKRMLHAMRVWGRPVVILGAGDTGRRVTRALKRTPLDGLHPIALFDDDPARRGQHIAGVRIRGPYDEMKAFARRHDVRHIIVATEKLDPSRRDHLVTGSDRTFLRVQFVPRLDGLPSEDVLAVDLDGMLALEVKAGLASRFNRAVKRAFDVVAVVVGGAIISPFLLLLAVAVYVDSPGPILFGHERIGRGGRRFKTWKFRSMVANAETVLEDHLAQHPELRAEWDQNHKLKNDVRVTRFGAFMRATSLDELPQLWNVLVGDMSLVGPRPIVTDEIPKYGRVFDLYTLVRPGITGHWQVSGRSETAYENRVDMDAHYVRNWSIWLDIVTLIRTVGVVLSRYGAY